MRPRAPVWVRERGLAKRLRHYWECPQWEDEGKYYDPLHTFHDWQAEERLRELWTSMGLVEDGARLFSPRNDTEVRERWRALSPGWLNDLHALQRARNQRRRRGIKPGEGTYTETTSETLHRLAASVGSSDGGSDHGGGGGRQGSTARDSRLLSRLKAGLEGAWSGRARSSGASGGGAGRRAAGKAKELAEAQGLMNGIDMSSGGNHSLGKRRRRAGGGKAKGASKRGGNGGGTALPKVKRPSAEMRAAIHKWASDGPKQTGGDGDGPADVQR